PARLSASARAEALRKVKEVADRTERIFRNCNRNSCRACAFANSTDLEDLGFQTRMIRMEVEEEAHAITEVIKDDLTVYVQYGKLYASKAAAAMHAFGLVDNPALAEGVAGASESFTVGEYMQRTYGVLPR